MLDRRRNSSPAAREEASLIIQKCFLETALFVHAKAVALYAPIQGEVDTDLVLEAGLASGKVVLYPVVEKGNMLFRSISGRKDLRIGLYGILEPNTACPEVDASNIDAFVIPGVAFDVSGNRIGFGKGYYDRTLHRLEGKGKLCGFCYDFQLLDIIVGEPHDVTMDKIITDRRVIDVSTGLHR